MPSRRIHKRPKSFSFNFLEDWRPYATPLPAPVSNSDWRYHGTVSVDGKKGALAWRAGWLGFGIHGQPVIELNLWVRIEIALAVEFRRAKGWETVPTFPPIQGHGMPDF